MIQAGGVPAPDSGARPQGSDAWGWASLAAGGLACASCCCTPIPFLGLLSTLLGLLLAFASIGLGLRGLIGAKREGRRVDLPTLGIALGVTRVVLTLGVVVGLAAIIALGVGVPWIEAMGNHPP